MRLTHLVPALLSLALPLAAAAETQSLTAEVDGVAFASDDDGITLVPLDKSFSLGAMTAGAMAWPPPKTRIDRLAITCEAYVPGTPIVFGSDAFGRSSCDVRFEVGRGADAIEYALDKKSATNRFEITASKGKAIEGTFAFDLVGKDGKRMAIRNGRFKAEDRQL